MSAPSPQIEMCWEGRTDKPPCVHGRRTSHVVDDEAQRCQADDRSTPIRVFVTETVEFEITVDPTEPRWEWLQDSPRAEWVSELDAVASETDGPVEYAIKRASVAGAWREVTHP